MRSLVWVATIVAPAFLLTALFWPGILFNDSSARWMSALLFLEKIPPGVWKLDASFPPAMSLLMAAVYRVTASVGAFTALQALVFFATLAMLVRALLGSDRRAFIGYGLVVLLPIVWTSSVFVSSDTWTASGLNAALALLIAPWPARRSRQAMHVLGFFLATWVLFGFRHNSLTVLPVILYLLVRIFRTERARACVLGGSLLAALLLVAATPSLFGFEKVDITPVVFTWEYVGTLRVLNDPAVLAEHNLDFLGGSTALAVQKHRWTTCDTLIWDSVFKTWVVVANGSEIRRRFWRLVRAHPTAWLRQKARVALTLLGVAESPIEVQREIHTTPSFARPYGISFEHPPDSARFIVLAIINDLDESLAWALRPALDLGLVMVLLAACGRRGVFPRHAGPLLAAAVFYYGGFLIAATGNHFRYYFPSFMLLLVLAVVALQQMKEAPARAPQN